MRCLLPVILVFVASLPAVAQEKDPPTKTEKFLGERGVVLIRTFVPVGEVSGKYGASLEIEARTFTRADTGQREFAIGFAVKENREEETSLVDLDDVKSLRAAIEYLRKVSPPGQAKGRFEATYRAPGGLEITLFDDADGTLNLAIEVGRIPRKRVFMSSVKLEQIGDLVAIAEDRLLGFKKDR